MGFDSDLIKDWLADCYHEATYSPDPSTQIGAGVVYMDTLWPETLSHNGPTRGWHLAPEDLERPRKYSILEHSERNAIYSAIRLGMPLRGTTLISTWAACADCARGIVQSGISTLIRHIPGEDDAVQRWLESVQLGDEILKAGGVDIIDVHGPIPGAPPILRSGELFYPGE